MRTRSPLPGMDPWLEAHWSSVHHRLITTFADQIQEQLPEGLYAEIEVTVYISDEAAETGTAIPDVAVFGEPNPSRSKLPSSDNIAVATPFRLKLPAEPVEEGHVVIRSLNDHESLVAAIEVLSPTNKADYRGRQAYILKREEYYQARANVVEIDLIRTGPELIGVPIKSIPTKLRTPYKACVHRARPLNDSEVDYYGFQLREVIPNIAIPLRRTDADVVLKIQDAIDLAYRNGRYTARLDYGQPPEPPLSPDDTAWAATLVSAAV